MPRGAIGCIVTCIDVQVEVVDSVIIHTPLGRSRDWALIASRAHYIAAPLLGSL